MVSPQRKRRYGEPIVLTSGGSTTRPRRISFTERPFDEGWLQNLIEANPELLPVADIEPAFSPLVSVGREDRCGGPLDDEDRHAVGEHPPFDIEGHIPPPDDQHSLFPNL